ncbi:MAG TPA: CARDB domain-containing protein [Thermoleophilaceae bacterium]|nr:CARDB domain-containing protein [Thermoleophilaceae bacterium]
MVLRIAALVTFLAAFPAVSSAARGAADGFAQGPVAKVVSCDVTSADRTATFYARMDTISGASKMQVRFQLLERLGRDEVWTKLDVPALRQWHTSQAGVRRFGWKQTVDALRIGGAYRAHVQYRWLSAPGSVLDTESRDTPVCRGPLPNIAVGGLSVLPGPTDDTRIYRVTIENRGKVDADGVDVSLSVDKAILDTVTLSHLQAGESGTTSFTGPVCTGGVRVRADPGNSIGETIEDDNSELFACP